MDAAFARAGNPVIGFDIDADRVRELQAGRARNCRLGKMTSFLLKLNLVRSVGIAVACKAPTL
jgi:UDP-N-acetyl-D-mannosaminuronate dehydrogenase